MAKKSSKVGGATSRDGENVGGTAVVVVASPAMRDFGGALVRVDQVHQVPALQPQARGTWSREADKIAWTDPETGLACIIRRAENGGHLCGFVAVEPGHPLCGFQYDAFPHVFEVSVHGGLDYSKWCEDGREEVSVCHVTETDGRDHKWWFGFSCDQPGDQVPDRPAKQDPTLSAEPAYRDEAYVLAQCTSLAAQLQAIGDGRPASAVGVPSAPPIGRDRRKAGK